MCRTWGDKWSCEWVCYGHTCTFVVGGENGEVEVARAAHAAHDAAWVPFDCNGLSMEYFLFSHVAGADDLLLCYYSPYLLHVVYAIILYLRCRSMSTPLYWRNI